MERVPTNKASPNYGLAMQNAQAGAVTIHDYVNVRLDDPANVVTTRGNITSILIPTQHLPLNNRRKNLPIAEADDRLDAEQRPLIDSAYDRPGPTPDQLAASLPSRLETIEMGSSGLPQHRFSAEILSRQ